MYSWLKQDKALSYFHFDDKRLLLEYVTDQQLALPNIRKYFEASHFEQRTVSTEVGPSVDY